MSLARVRRVVISAFFYFVLFRCSIVTYCIVYTKQRHRSAPLHNIIMLSVTFSAGPREKKKNRLFKTCLNINHTGIFFAVAGE